MNGTGGLRGRAERAFPSGDIAGSLGKVRAIIGVPHIPDSEAAAQRALDALRRGEVPPASELAALEFVIRLLRQAPLSRKGTLDSLENGGGSHLFDPQLLTSWERFRHQVQPFLYSVGRIDLLGGGPQGTGFVVAPGLILTNRHVLGVISNGTEVLDGNQAIIRFHQEFGSPDPPGSAVKILRAVAVHPRLDMALLEIADPDRPALPLREDGIDQGAAVATIGYPLADPLRNPIFADAIFQGRFGVKRAAVGEVVDRSEETISHDCSTMGGNSGSPVFGLTEGTVAGIHFSGFFMYRNSAIAAPQIAAFLVDARPDGP